MVQNSFLPELKLNIAAAALAVTGLLFVTWLFSYLVKRLLLRLFPPETFNAGIVSKRLEVKNKNKEPKTLYYITFQTGESGERTEYKTPSGDYALSAVGDNGVLKLHLGKFMSFERC